MFEEDVYNRLSAIQCQIAEIRKIYTPYITPELKDALGAAHTKVDTAVDLAEAALTEHYPYAEEAVEPIYPDLASATAALDRGEKVRIACRPVQIDQQLLQTAQDLQDKEQLQQLPPGFFS